VTAVHPVLVLGRWAKLVDFDKLTVSTDVDDAALTPAK
jgi:hypothetical protein